MTRAPGWRDRAATDLLLKHLPWLGAERPALVLGDPHGEEVAEAVTEVAGGDGGTTVWRRRVRGDRPASPWPPAAPTGEGYRTAFLRLPKSRNELEMLLHAVAHRLGPDGRLFVHGAKDEGAGSVAGRLAPLFQGATSVATGGRCRLVSALRADPVPDLRAELDRWRIETEPPHPDVEAERWVSYPGVFAAGRLDDGTALLLEHLPEVGPDSRVLDFGCGDGVVAGVLAGRTPGLRPVMLDQDTVALAAAAENVPAGRVVAADGIGSLGTTPPFDLVVSNPPYHRGKAETLEVVRELVRGTAVRLASSGEKTRRGGPGDGSTGGSPSGSLTLVVQRRLPVDTLLAGAFRSVEILADRGAFRVWRAAR